MKLIVHKGEREKKKPRTQMCIDLFDYRHICGVWSRSCSEYFFQPKKNVDDLFLSQKWARVSLSMKRSLPRWGLTVNRGNSLLWTICYNFICSSSKLNGHPQTPAIHGTSMGRRGNSKSDKIINRPVNGTLSHKQSWLLRLCASTVEKKKKKSMCAR